MGTTMNRAAFEELVEGDLEWLAKQPHSIEKDHIAQIVRESVDLHYPPPGVTLRCGGCDHTGPPTSFEPSASPYHDFVCPSCGTTQVDTSEINADWKTQGQTYGFGDHNSLDTSAPR